LQELMQKSVFTPLEMSRTSMIWQERFEDDYANGYDEYGRSLGPERRKSADAAGSMQTTLRDFSRFMAAVMRGQGLQQKTRELMLSPQIQITSKQQFPALENEPTDENKAIRLGYGHGAADLGQENCHDRSDRLEKRSVLRRPTSETTNSLSVSDRVRSLLGIFSGGGPSGSRDSLVRERVSAKIVGAVCLAHVVSQETLGPPG